MVTAAVDAMKSRAGEGRDVITLRATVNAAWRTSMEVGVRVEAEHVPTGEVAHTCTAYVTCPWGGREARRAARRRAADSRRRAAPPRRQPPPRAPARRLALSILRRSPGVQRERGWLLSRAAGVRAGAPATSTSGTAKPRLHQHGTVHQKHDPCGSHRLWPRCVAKLASGPWDGVGIPGPNAERSAASHLCPTPCKQPPRTGPPTRAPDVDLSDGALTVSVRRGPRPARARRARW